MRGRQPSIEPTSTHTEVRRELPATGEQAVMRAADTGRDRGYVRIPYVRMPGLRAGYVHIRYVRMAS